MKKLFLTLLVLAAFKANTQVVINEYCGANVSQSPDTYGNFSDWVELYNPTAGPIDLSGYHLSDNNTKPTKYVIPAGVSIAANSFLKVYCNGQNTGFVSGNLNTSFKLTQTKPEEIVLADPSGTIVDEVTMVPCQPNHSRGRTTDGAATWSLFKVPTLGSPNTGAFVDYTAKPSFNFPAGAYSTPLSIVLTADAGSTIYYTTDGTTPTTLSAIYSTPIIVNSTTVIRAMAVNPDPMRPTSFIETNTYLINEYHTIPVVSVSGDNIMTLLNGTMMEPETTLEYFGADGFLKTEVSGNSNEHGNDSWAYDQRGFDFIGNDEFGINYGLTHKIFKRKDRDEFQRVILKAAASDNYPFEGGATHIRDAYVHTLSHDADLALDERTYEPCIVYVNGQYWGVYEIREKVDDNDFCDYYYKQDEPYIYFLQTWGGTWEAYTPAPGVAQADWNSLISFINTNTLTIDANYDYVDSLLNTKSLIDYFILNSYTVCADWLNWNTAWWRGTDTTGDKKKWRYTLWDMDATFGHYVNFTGIPDQGAGADPCAPEDLPDPGGQGHVTLLDSLLKNDKFHQDYINRYIDLNNSALSCDNMIDLLDSLIGNIDDEMPRHIAKWGGTYAEWQTNVATLRNYIIARCDSITEGLKDCYNLNGPYTITFRTDPPDVASIDVNTLTLAPSQLPYTGTYYGGIITELDTQPVDTNYEFSHWELVNVVTPSTDSAKVDVEFTTSQEVIAHYIIPATLFVPSAFSPNGDGINDILMIMGKGIKSVKFDIYNRWGERVFYSEDKDSGWDGSFRGQKAMPGVYAYRAYVEYLDGTNKTQKGNVTLVR